MPGSLQAARMMRWTKNKNCSSEVLKMFEDTSKSCLTVYTAYHPCVCVCVCVCVLSMCCAGLGCEAVYSGVSGWCCFLFPDPREELRQLLLKHGEMKDFEVEVKRWKLQEQSEKTRGGSHTEVSLTQKGWTEHLLCNSANMPTARYHLS